MVLTMARPWKHPKTGVYWVRKVVPEHLRAAVGKREERRSLKTKDPEAARQLFPAALAEVEKRWASLRAGPQPLTEREAHDLAVVIHDNWLAMHRDEPSAQLTWHTKYYHQLWNTRDPFGEDAERDPDASIPVDHILVSAMRRFCLAQTDFGMVEHGLVLDDHDRFKLARAIGAALQRASLKLEKLAEGELADDVSVGRTWRAGTVPQPTSSTLRGASEPTRSADAKITVLLASWWREAEAAGRKPSTYESYRNTVKALVAFLAHDDLARVSPRDVVGFKDHRLSTPSPRTGRVPSAKTVKDSDLTALKTLFGWAVANHWLTDNPASGITIKVGKPQRLRSKGFTDAEAEAILRAALRHTRGQESPRTAAAKKWVPWLCAFTGARVGEMAQLRKQDLTRAGDLWVLRITPEAGTVKTNQAREVVLHPQLVELGFPEFVASAEDGALFLTPKSTGEVLGPLQGLKNRLAEFARAVVPDPNVAPNHGWRHRFKTIGMEAGIAPRILDAIQGQAARSVADTYGDVTIKTMAAAIEQIPFVAAGSSAP